MVTPKIALLTPFRDVTVYAVFVSGHPGTVEGVSEIYLYFESMYIYGTVEYILNLFLVLLEISFSLNLLFFITFCLIVNT